ncbi:glycosyltransferase [Shewanella sp. Sh95]|uniref:glycosyltransferase n=1 Tax=Shewanella sp. Sh95 TaxID=1689868 RepID=UPI0006E43807|nr:glycosyltransferase [Shewanella sp. Sh95]
MEVSNIQPVISVVIPVYNVEKFLERCLDSVISQTFKNFEVICVNDGSPDNCDVILNRYKKSDTRVRVINQDNQGVSIARNNGLNVARGDYIYFIDPDDAIQPQTLEIAHLFAKNNQADLVVWQSVYSDGLDNPDKTFEIDKIKLKLITEPLYHKNKKPYKIGSVVWNKLYKKELIKGLCFIPGVNYEDISYSFSVLARRPKTIIIPTPLYLYTKYEKSITQQKPTPKLIRDYHIVIDSIYDTYQKNLGSKELRHIKNTMMRPLLSYQLKKCKQAGLDQKVKMLRAFAEELRDLDNKGLLTWRGHSILRYIAYKKLMRTI